MLARLLVPQTPHSPLGHGCGIQTLGDVSAALPHVHVRGGGGGEMPWHQSCPMDGPDTWALPELVFSICSHEINPTFCCCQQLWGTFVPNQMQPSLCSLVMSAMTCGEPVMGACGPFPRRLQNQEWFWEGTNPHMLLPCLLPGLPCGKYSPSLSQLPVRDSREMASWSASRRGCQFRTKIRAGSGWEKNAN